MVRRLKPNIVKESYSKEMNSIFWNVQGIIITSGLLQSDEGLHVNFARDPKYS